MSDAGVSCSVEGQNLLLVFRNVLGQDAVHALLDYVGCREAAFRPGVVHDRKTGRRKIDLRLHRGLAFSDVGPFREPIEAFVRGVADQSIARLSLIEPRVEPAELFFRAHGDGDYMRSHVDTIENPNGVRVLSCVYYFATTPRRFSGGDFRLIGLPLQSGGSRATVEISPETDSMIVFPSWVPHEVSPVSVPSGAWLDCRFTLNCWLHRAAAPA
jgi:SM-20-related protein